MLPIIFLDIDGVLNHRGSYGPELPRGKQRFAPECVARLNTLIDVTGAEIVVSSTWRDYPDIREILTAAGVNGTVIGVTPQLRDTSNKSLVVLPIPRGFEIALWIEWHGGDRPFVILDDDADMAMLSWALVKTSFESGLQDEHIDRAVEILAGSPERSAIGREIGEKRQ